MVSLIRPALRCAGDTKDMAKKTDLITYIRGLGRRAICPIAQTETDFGFWTMDKVQMAEDLGFTAKLTGSTWNVVAVPFNSVDEVRRYNWNSTDDKPKAGLELAYFSGAINSAVKPLGGGSFGPLTVSSLILGVEHSMRLTVRNPDVLHEVLDRVTEYVCMLAREEEKLGADFFWIAEPVASLLSDPACREFNCVYINRICKAVDIPVMLHVCGDTNHQVDALLSCGIDGISIDYMTDMGPYLQAAPQDMIVMGNISPMLVWEGDVRDVREAVWNLLELAEGYDNFVLSTGCVVPEFAPKENVEAIRETAQEYSKSQGNKKDEGI